MIEINPRISTIVYQEDLNLPYLGVKHALGEISEEELGALAVARPADAGALCGTSTRWSGTSVRGSTATSSSPGPSPHLP